MTGEEFPHNAAAKQQLRTRVLDARAALTAAELATTAELIADHVDALLDRGPCLAAYVSMGSEPGTDVLLTRVWARGVRVLLPVLLPDNDLDWATYEGPGSLAAAGRGLREPRTPLLGVDAITDADLVLVPGLAVSRDGVRLGRGGGSYDRALARIARVRPPIPTMVALHPGEVGLAVPAEPHDRTVNLVVTREGVTRPG
ncbi:5-formyltetrahydrofolate cyclo-ligase [Nocardioides gilvus]|uniref:5-formyltetrahydrofolate cyclo-ligase n=1 Tax=Nocardioides gilvus TaxID=1735589 RepID=UPI000D74D0F4|nr:5-formyltetrahydrofolate cyclo-ligase [Nocardioides gilvus]